MDQFLMILGASIFGILGLIHLIYTFFSNKFDAYDSSVTEAMKGTSIVLTKDTTIWNAWIGFNASHSLGALLVAGFYIPLAIFNFDVIRESLWFSVLPAVIGFSYSILAKKYWFKIPLAGISISTLCFIGSAVLVNK